MYVTTGMLRSTLLGQPTSSNAALPFKKKWWGSTRSTYNNFEVEISNKTRQRFLFSSYPLHSMYHESLKVKIHSELRNSLFWLTKTDKFQFSSDCDVKWLPSRLTSLLIPQVKNTSEYEWRYTSVHTSFEDKDQTNQRGDGKMKSRGIWSVSATQHRNRTRFSLVSHSVALPTTGMFEAHLTVPQTVLSSQWVSTIVSFNDFSFQFHEIEQTDRQFFSE
jgi:hypothetical protein